MDEPAEASGARAKAKDCHRRLDLEGSGWFGEGPGNARMLTHIRKWIENGTPLPSTYYSKQAGSSVDALLKAHGIMHLHLGKWNSSELLWVVQYTDRVVWLELSDNAPFSTEPPGRNLLIFHQTTLRGQDVISAPRRVGEVKLRPRVKVEAKDKGDE